MRLIIGHLEDFARTFRDRLDQLDWETQRGIIRTLVKRVEIDQGQVNVVFRVGPGPLVAAPDPTSLPKYIVRTPSRSAPRAEAVQGAMGGLGLRSAPDPVRSLVSQRIRLSSMVTVSPAVRGRWPRLRRHDLRIAHVCTPPWGHSVDRVGPICQPTVLLLGQHPNPCAGRLAHPCP